MGSNTSKTLFSYHQKEINNSPDRFLCDNFNNECEKSVRIKSSGNKSIRNKNKFCRIPKSRTSYEDAQSEDVESGEFLGEGTNKTLFPQRQHLQTTSSGELVNCVPLHTVQTKRMISSYVCCLVYTKLLKNISIPQRNTSFELMNCNFFLGHPAVEEVFLNISALQKKTPSQKTRATKR